MRQELKNQLKDNKGLYTSYGAYKEVYEDMKSDLSKLKDNSRRIITYRTFASVVRLYFRFVVKELIDGYSFTLNNRFGELRIAKRKMVRYIPNLMDISKGEDGKVVIGQKNGLEVARKYKWFWHYLNWTTFKRYRTHEIKPSRYFKKTMMERVNRGFEYIDYTPLNMREGGHIHKIK